MQQKKLKALITGVNGMDGSNLSEYLLSLDYEVHGVLRRNSMPEHQDFRINHLSDSAKTYYGDLTDSGSIEKILTDVMPDEIYHLGAQSHVKISFEVPHYTTNVNAIGTLNVFEAFRKICPKAKVYFAASSEMFGNSVDADFYQKLDTPMNPASPYGASKLFGFSLAKNYRNAYGLHIGCGILFNHSSPRRGANFVEQKIVQGAVNIFLKKQDQLVLGNMDSYRDIGASRDYVRAMHRILNHNIADDFIVATEQTCSVRDLCKIIFDKLNMNYTEYVIQDVKFLRPEELKYLRGDASKFKNTFADFKLEYTLDKLLDEMIAVYLYKRLIELHGETKVFSLSDKIDVNKAGVKLEAVLNVYYKLEANEIPI